MAVEYDVVKCEDFTEDKWAWQRNMPEEVRILTTKDSRLTDSRNTTISPLTTNPVCYPDPP